MIMMKNGYYKEFIKHEGVTAEGVYVDGLRIGRWEFSWDEGYSIGHYENGIEDGFWFNYENGDITINFFEQGLLLQDIEELTFKLTKTGKITECKHLKEKILKIKYSRTGDIVNYEDCFGNYYSTEINTPCVYNPFTILSSYLENNVLWNTNY